MADSKQIRIGVDNSEYQSNMQRIRSEADSLFRELVRSSRAYSTSSKEVLADIEEQIKAIEKRNKLDLDFRKRELESRRETGVISEDKYQSKLTAVKAESADDKLQIQLLRELIQGVRDTSKEEIREDRIQVERQIASSKTASILSPEGDEYDILRETVQRGIITQNKIEENIEDSVTEGMKKGIHGLGAVAQSNNVYEAVGRAGQVGAGEMAGAGGMMGVMGALALVGLGVGMKAVQATMPYEQARARVYGQTGSMASGFGMAGYGYTADQVVAEQVAINAARGTSVGGSQAARNSLLMQRGLGLDQGTIVSMERILRGENTSSRSVTQDIIKSMRVAGLSEGKDLSLLPEYMQTLIQVSQEQLNTLGEIDMGMNIRMVQAISSLDESFKNPQILGNVVASLRSGLQQAKSPQQQALQYSILSRMGGGNLSMFEMEKMRENPFGEESRGYLQSYLGSLNQMSMGNRDMFYFNIMEQFGVGAKMAEKIGGGFLDKNKDFNKLLDEASLDGEGVDISGRAGRGTGVLMSSTAQWTNGLIKIGTTITDGLSDLIATVGRIEENLKEIDKNGKENIAARAEVAEKIANIANSTSDPNARRKALQLEAELRITKFD